MKIVKICIVFVAGIFAAVMLFRFLDKPENLIQGNQKSETVTVPASVALPPIERPSPAVRAIDKPEKLNLALPELILSGVAVSGDKSWAVINDRVVRLGDNVKGAKIVAIYSGRVELEFEGNSITLTIK